MVLTDSTAAQVAKVRKSSAVIDYLPNKVMPGRYFLSELWSCSHQPR
jgi:hypothetical protein